MCRENRRGPSSEPNTKSHENRQKSLVNDHDKRSGWMKCDDGLVDLAE